MMRPVYRIIIVFLVGFIWIQPQWSLADMPSGWETVDEGITDGPSMWIGSDGLISQLSNIYSEFGLGTDPEKPGTYALAGQASWSDYALRVDMRSMDNDGIGVMFRYQDTDNYYRFSMDRQRAYRRLIKKVAGQVIVLAEDAVPYIQDRWYALNVTVEGNRLTVTLDGQTIFSVTDESLKSGKIALYSWGNAGCEFDNIIVESDAGLLFSTLDLNAPIIEFTNPTQTDVYDSDSSAIDLTGTATDEGGVSHVRWENSLGGGGMASGTSDWSILNLPLFTGENKIRIAATDQAGNQADRTLTVTYYPEAPGQELPQPLPAVAVGQIAAELPDAAVPDTAGAAIADQAMAALPILQGTDYVIDPGDVLEISVWKDDALTKTVTVLPDGKIAFPLIGAINVQGKTVAQLTAELTQKIEPFVPDPIVTVVVVQINSMLIYVIGKVNNPGRFPLIDEVDVLQALAIAGGFNPFAKKNKIKIFRRTDDSTQADELSHTQIIEFNYEDVAKGKNLEQNIGLKKGDVIVVP